MGMGMGMGPYKLPYVAVTGFEIKDASNPQYNLTRNLKNDFIKVRGNSTSQTAKKPYRIQFGEKTSLFGREAAKSWVLLANFYDGTFALNAIAFELGRRLGLEFTPTYQFVNLYINNKYMGIYQLTEQIQSNKGRVAINEKDGGWLVEFDYHEPTSDNCLKRFVPGRYDLTANIKAPDLDDFKNPKDSTQLNFVKNDIMALINKMAAGGFPENGYHDLIDLESFAKYMLIQLFMDNFDFNSKAQSGALLGSNFMYKIDKTSKIKAGPLWDLDLSAGVTMSNFPKHYQTYKEPITPTHAFYKRLWQDPAFKAEYKKTWDKYKSDFQDMIEFIDNISAALSDSIQAKGANITMDAGALTLRQFTNEISKLKTWWTNRLKWVDQNSKLKDIDTTRNIIKVQITPAAPLLREAVNASEFSARRRELPSRDRIRQTRPLTPFHYLDPVRLTAEYCAQNRALLTVSKGSAPVQRWFWYKNYPNIHTRHQSYRFSFLFQS